MQTLIYLAAGTAFALAGAAQADTISQTFNIEGFGGDDADGSGDGTEEVVINWDFSLPDIMSIDSFTVDLAHYWYSDLEMYLTAPNGDVFSVFADGKIDGNDLGDGDGVLLENTVDYTFAESGPDFVDFDHPDPVPSGTYAANEWHAGSYATGTWNFMLIDNFDTLDGGSVGSVAVNYTLIPGPGALALLGMAGLVSRRRRRD